MYFSADNMRSRSYICACTVSWGITQSTFLQYLAIVPLCSERKYCFHKTSECGKGWVQSRILPRYIPHRWTSSWCVLQIVPLRIRPSPAELHSVDSGCSSSKGGSSWLHAKSNFRSVNQLPYQISGLHRFDHLSQLSSCAVKANKVESRWMLCLWLWNEIRFRKLHCNDHLSRCFVHLMSPNCSGGAYGGFMVRRQP